MPQAKTLMTREEAAEYLGVKPQTLAAWACTGRYGLPAYKVGRLLRYRREDLDRWIESRRRADRHAAGADVGEGGGRP